MLMYKVKFINKAGQETFKDFNHLTSARAHLLAAYYFPKDNNDQGEWTQFNTGETATIFLKDELEDFPEQE